MLTTNHTPGGSARRRDRGFTMVEILIAIVLVGILSAVVVVGVGTLTDQGEASACTASLDASKAAAIVYFAQNGAYPDSFTDMTGADALSAPSDVTVAATTLTGNGWTLTLSGGGATRPTFVCS
jgi:prepilin-type N-terminal cleavage/methylation domain-containing protein